MSIEHPNEVWMQSYGAAMRGVLERARTVAPTRATVLLSGETGVGKGVLARQIHLWSNRKDKPFVSVHCGAIPETLLESELFGHERGSFTGAERRTQGKLQLAHEGSVFLDEVDSVPPASQIKLLDVLQERRFRRVGGEQDIEVDVRFIAATNGDLARAQREGRFRTDLYHRLNVFPIEIPPLRERTEDLGALTDQVLARLNRVYCKEIRGLEPIVEEAFRAYAWPGNVRELENLLERAYILESAALISARHIPIDVLNSIPGHPESAPRNGRTLSEVRRRAAATAEVRYLEETLAVHHGRIDASARAAGISTRQLRKLLARHGIHKSDFKLPRRDRDPRPRLPAGDAG